MGNSRIQKFDSDGNFITMWGSKGIGESKFSDSIPGIGIESSDKIYVVDRKESVIQKFDSEGNFITMWGSKGSGEGGEMNKPEDIAINPKNKNVYITDTKNSRIIEFTLLKQ
jgi:DNA-binding beta-propeller fold protein YncE